MTRAEIIGFIQRNSTSYLATMENGEPRVRAMETPLADENGLTFCTGSRKDVCIQLLANPLVELCYFSSEERIQLRVRGLLNRLDDLAVKKRIVEEKFTFLKPVVEQFGWEALTLFHLDNGEARVWSAENPAGGSESFSF